MMLTVHGLARGRRLDAFLRGAQPNWGRQAVQRLIGGRHVAVNGRTVWLGSWLVENGDVVTVDAGGVAQMAAIAAAALPLFTAFEDSWLLSAQGEADDSPCAPGIIAVNKPAGLLAEAPPHRPDAPNLHTLAQARFGPLTLFHRLDRDTSGVILLTRTAEANRRLAAAFQQRTAHKEYVAVVHAPNRLAAAGVIDRRIGPHPARRDQMAVVAKGGQHAITRYACAAAAPDRQWLRLWPETGRTHQLRVHLAACGAPILGDRLYADPATQGAERLLLHAHRLTLPAWDELPPCVFAAPLPPELSWPAELAWPGSEQP